jgi:deazaflavin-dependent oxidoreductase (nitroreductase family)
MAWIYARMQHRVDRLAFKLTRGRATVSSWASGLPIVMLTTVGARTGRKRTVPLLGIRDGAGVVLVASNYGRSRHPAWYHNLMARPRVWIALDGASQEFEARELTGYERVRWLQRAIEIYPGFLAYRRWAAGRRIPVIKLEPVS